MTGNINVIRKEHFKVMKDGAIVANSGHFNVELDLPGLESLSVSRRTIRPFVEEFVLKGGRRVNVLGEGRLINLAAAEGHPSSVMDMSFANQALSVEYMVRLKKPLERNVYPVPEEIDQRDRAREARRHGGRDRHADTGAGEVSGVLGNGDLTHPKMRRRPHAALPAASTCSHTRVDQYAARLGGLAPCLCP